MGKAQSKICKHVLKVFVGERMEAQISYQDVRLLSKGVSSTGAPSCSNIRFDDCVMDVVEKRLMEGPGCLTPWIKNTTK